MKGRTRLIFYVLSVYVIVQFIWWGYHMIDLTQEVAVESQVISKRVAMIIGEGAVFLLILFVGIWQIHRSIRKDLKLTERQNNFLLSVTHELKTPLAASKLYVQTILKRDLSKEQTHQILQKAVEENDRLERMIDNILNASRLESKALVLSKEEIDLSQLIQHTIDRFSSITRSTNLTSTVDSNSFITADRLMLETILNNLIENALKYAGNNVPIEVYATTKNGITRFGVKDGGAGIPDQHHLDVFQKFYRIGNEDTRTQKGSGLGLYIVAELVRLHHWSISYKHNTPNGAHFSITTQHG